MTQTIARIPLDAQLACVRREISYRSRVYPRLVEAHKMTQRKADEEISVMGAVLDTLLEQERKERLL